MSNTVYHIGDDGTLRAMTEQPYDYEADLQTLLERYPELLAGEQVDAVEPRRWLLVAREVGVPGEEGGSDRWSLDHLFLDQDGVPSFVEVKRSTDTRIRREVVGQMLDYAANATAYWSVSRLRSDFDATARSHGHDPTDSLLGFLGADAQDELAVERFWAGVERNMGEGLVRLVFVADRIPLELRRIIEFLGERMTPTEVLGVEVRQFVSETGLRTVVPTVVGQTASTLQKKEAAAKGEVWTAERFLPELARRDGQGAAAIAKEILDWAASRGLEISGGSGARSGSLFPVLRHNNDWQSFASLWTYGAVEMQFQHMRGPFKDERARADILRQLNEIPGIALDPGRIKARPSFPITALSDPEHMARFLEIWETYLDRFKAS